MRPTRGATRRAASTSTAPRPPSPSTARTPRHLASPPRPVDSYELGVKTTLFDRTLLLNATAFHQKFKNFQLNTFLGTTFIGGLDPGGDLQGRRRRLPLVHPGRRPDLPGRRDLRRDRVRQLRRRRPDRPGQLPAACRCCRARSCRSRRSGRAPARSATTARSATACRSAPTSRPSTRPTTTPARTCCPFKDQDAYTLVNGRIAIGSADDRWTLELWGQNLTDEDYIQVGYDAPLQGTAFQRRSRRDGSPMPAPTTTRPPTPHL